jgi:tRNA(Phe) wybutosine-synthesizing methylase Tyw3
MCKWNKYGDTRIDPCMRKLIDFINTHPNVKTISSCCGHGRYNMSIIVKYKTGIDGKYKWKVRELLSGIELPKRTKYYKRDARGYYYIPEVIA